MNRNMLSLRRLISSLSIVLMGIFTTGTTFADEKIVSIGGSVTEIIYALGEGDRLIARDSTSYYPPSVRSLPDVGYMRQLAPEGVLSVEPDLIIAEERSGPQETIDVLAAAQVPFIIIPDGFDRKAVITKIQSVADVLNVSKKGELMANEINDELLSVERSVGEYDGTKKRVLFILSTAGGRIMAAGTDTAANGIITMAGGMNVFDSFHGYKPVSNEAVSASTPDVILMMTARGHSGTDEELFSMPALLSTPAAINRQIIRMDGLLLLGFGPRTGEAVMDLHSALYGESQ